MELSAYAVQWPINSVAGDLPFSPLLCLLYGAFTKDVFIDTADFQSALVSVRTGPIHTPPALK